jgi:hypothetical protein
MENRISFEFARFSDEKLKNQIQLVLASMADNPNFTSPSPQLAAVQEAAADFNTAWVAAKSRDLLQISEKNDQKAVLIALMKELAYYAMSVAKGSRTVLLSSGFELTKGQEPSLPLQQPSKVVLSDGQNPGELKVSLERVKGAKSYQYEYTTDMNAEEVNWVSRSGTTTGFTFTNLEIGKRYYCRVAATGSRNQMVYSQIVSRIVQ